MPREEDKLVRTVLVRAAQLADIENAPGTALLLSRTDGLLNYLCDTREWGTLADECRALEDYTEILRACFGATCRIDCTLSADRFIKRRVLLKAFMNLHATDRIVDCPEARELVLEIGAGAQEKAVRLRLQFIGENAPADEVLELDC